MNSETTHTSSRSTRIQKGKSRRGCHRCKARHVKCDEIRPKCGNCERINVQCPGYERVLQWSGKHERFRVAAGHGERVVDARRQPCTSSTVTTSVTGGETEQIGIWDGVYSIDAADSGDVNVITSQTGIQRYTILPNPVDIPTTLIEYWFSHVCPMWSTFDSDVNYNRQIATVYCTTSEVIFCALQSMSAACLSEITPDLKDSFAVITAQASTVIQQRILNSQDGLKAEAGNIAIDLVYAVFALGTSLHWNQPFPSHNSWLTSARVLLRRWQLNHGDLQPEIYAYFRQALVYWEMLLSTTNIGSGHESGHEELNGRRTQHQQRFPLITTELNTDLRDIPRQVQSCEAPSSSRGTRPNSWCGISSNVISIFGQIVTLYCTTCERRRTSDHTTTAATIHAAISDISIARELQTELLAMDFNDTIASDEIQGFSLHTGDNNTPLAHHIYTAEAYRLASLIQLYLAYTDLDVQPWKDGSALVDGNVLDTTPTLRTEKLLGLSVQLVRILQCIPSSSGSRRMLPMLYITAAAGLRYIPDQGGSRWEFHKGASTSSIPASTTLATWTKKEEVSHMRTVVTYQLYTLQQTLPRRPLRVAVDLVNAIWAAYDGDTGTDVSGTSWIHWPDIMTTTGFQTLFG